MRRAEALYLTPSGLLYPTDDVLDSYAIITIWHSVSESLQFPIRSGWTLGLLDVTEAVEAVEAVTLKAK